MSIRTVLIGSAITAFSLSLAGASFAGPDRAEPREVRSVEHASPTDRAGKTDSPDKSHDSTDRSHDSSDKSDSQSPDKAEQPDPNSGR